MAHKETKEPKDPLIATVAPAAAEPEPSIPKYRQCPLCWGELHGKGKAYSTQGRTRYYRCDTCGHTWTARVVTEVTQIEHRRVDVDTR